MERLMDIFKDPDFHIQTVYSYFENWLASGSSYSTIISVLSNILNSFTSEYHTIVQKNIYVLNSFYSVDTIS